MGKKKWFLLFYFFFSASLWANYPKKSYHIYPYSDILQVFSFQQVKSNLFKIDSIFELIFSSNYHYFLMSTKSLFMLISRNLFIKRNFFSSLECLLHCGELGRYSSSFLLCFKTNYNLCFSFLTREKSINNFRYNRLLLLELKWFWFIL